MKPSIKLLSAACVALSLSCGAWAASAAELDPAAIAAAKTAADHEAIAKAFQDEAATLDREAALHEEMAKTYGEPGGKPWMKSQAKHCTHVAAELKAAARGERALAREHLKLAKEASE